MWPGGVAAAEQTDPEESARGGIRAGELSANTPGGGSTLSCATARLSPSPLSARKSYQAQALSQLRNPLLPQLAVLHKRGSQGHMQVAAVKSAAETLGLPGGFPLLSFYQTEVLQN